MLLDKNINPFENTSGASRLSRPIAFMQLALGALLISFLSAKLEIIGIVLCMGAFVMLVYSYFLFKNPRIGILTILILSFILVGLGRYIPGTWGLAVDGLLIFMYIALFFKGFGVKIQWNKANSPLTVFSCVWMAYVVLQIANPEAVSSEAWFYAMRGYALYQWLLIPLVFILFNKPKDLNIFLLIWGMLSLLGTLKGMQQYFMGVDSFEQRWLDGGGAETHVLFGKLRIFSFYSDAGQFGASQGHAAVVFGILAFYLKNNLRLKSFFILVALAGLFGMIISGTRGALAVPAMGGIMFLILRKNIQILILGAILGIGIYVFFAHTTIGQNNAEIRRMRTAFDPNEASLQVRIDNQKRFASYLSTRPFGGGVGSAGNWGQRFSPHTFLANTATDSWYVAIWAETGIVGLCIHLSMLFFVLGTGIYNVMFKLNNESIRIQITALTCGMAGIMAASYGNSVFGQFPTAFLIYISMVFMFIAPKWDKEVTENNKSLKETS